MKYLENIKYKEINLRLRRLGSITYIKIIKNVAIATTIKAPKPTVNNGQAAEKPE